MKDLKHIKRFNESEENLNISDVSDSDLERISKEIFEEHEGYPPVSYTDMKSVELIQLGLEKGLSLGYYVKYNLGE
jgi:hypothetical protein